MLKHLTREDVSEICAIAAQRHGLEDLDHVYKIDPYDRDELTAIERTGVLTDLLEARIECLTPSAREELTALAWLGRGDEEGDFDALLAYAKQTNGAGTPRYLANKLPLGLYLQKGMRELERPTE